MDPDLHQLGEDLVTTAARLIRWMPTDGLGLSLSATRLMARILDNGPCRISDLAIQESSSQPTITNHIKRLEAAGWVSRTVNENDARAWMIDLTDSGREQLRTMRHQLGSNVEPALSKLNKRELKAVADGIKAMQRVMTT